ncbi:2-phytyl-1,4-beta-naphthoquinone methyltransferase, chloroplastic-like protein [Cinnamomum micranthum f. kanehirae]|uniref:2-phytyl-1,4-beta-naphthoquinone methyltransferase, chloroplastic-like protein n=1 Tax=Cinnamomum micranthum f. kanehirae TaxID=337451 RepID=A0A443N5U0_9MAGN|nr:2-phytyl-1,4-beta-naphthoquinone methyltransferase, chloroplastic-like protein [Cinnamomum micranthum f. kanehirae]
MASLLFSFSHFPGRHKTSVRSSSERQLLFNRIAPAYDNEWLIDNVVVPVASSYGLAKEYAYLKSSINNFSTGKELEKLAKEVGFSKAKHYEIGGGLMGNLVATR